MYNMQFLFVNKCEICVRNHNWKYLPQSTSIYLFPLTFCVVFFWAHCKDQADFTISSFIFLQKCQHLSLQLMHQQNTVWDFPFPDISASEFTVMNVIAHFLQGTGAVNQLSFHTRIKLKCRHNTKMHLLWKRVQPFHNFPSLAAQPVAKADLWHCLAAEELSACLLPPSLPCSWSCLSALPSSAVTHQGLQGKGM